MADYDNERKSSKDLQKSEISRDWLKDKFVAPIHLHVEVLSAITIGASSYRLNTRRCATKVTKSWLTFKNKTK